MPSSFIHRPGERSPTGRPHDSLSRHGRDWEEMASVDPLWAILSDPAMRFSKWDVDAFFRTGEEEISALMKQAADLSLPVQRRLAIDFGCGVGRLTRALRRYFPRCFGIDISPTMLEQAKRLAPECDFLHSSNLSSFPNGCADLIYSNLVLQHQPTAKAVSVLIKDMMRALAPGGLLVFQLPTQIPFRYRIQVRRRLYRLGRALGLKHDFLYSELGLTPIRMISLSQEVVTAAIVESDGTIVSVRLKQDKPFSHRIYYCTRRTGPLGSQSAI
jgi:SAM-dependent methyltransferase